MTKNVATCFQFFVKNMDVTAVDLSETILISSCVTLTHKYFIFCLKFLGFFNFIEKQQQKVKS